MRVWGERNEKELCGQVSVTTLELKRLKVSLLQTSSDPLQCKSALCFSKKRNVVYINMGFPGGASGKEPTCQCRRQERPRFDPWVRKIPWSRKWQPIPIFLPGESQGQNSLAGYSLWVGHNWSDLTCMHAYTNVNTYILFVCPNSIDHENLCFMQSS